MAKQNVLGVACVAGVMGVASGALGQAVTVDAKAAIFDAGRAAPSLDGVLPPFIGVPGGCGRTFTIAGVSGMVRPFPAALPGGADGNANYPATSSHIDAANGISGIATPLVFPLLGVFLDDFAPGEGTPDTLDFIAGGTTFTVLAPRLHQTFFIGDGVTGTAPGVSQQFIVPEGATRLFLGFADGPGFSGAPGQYGDNTGSIAATVSIHVDAVTPPVVELETGGGVECPGTNVLSILADSDGPTQYAWRRDGAIIVNGPSGNGSIYAGADTATLAIQASSTADGGVYDCVVTNACGPTTSDAATLRVLDCCPDYTNDGNVDQDDVYCLIAIIAGDPACSDRDPDFNRDGNVDQGDIDALINVIAGGPCP